MEVVLRDWLEGVVGVVVERIRVKIGEMLGEEEGKSKVCEEGVKGGEVGLKG